MEYQVDIDGLVKDISKLEAQIAEQEEKLKKSYPMVDELEEDRARLTKMKNTLKEELVRAEDFDLHMSDDRKYSVSKITKLEVENMADVPSEFKEVLEVADTKKAQDYCKLMGEPPAGFKDKSYYKLNWKEL